MPKYLLKRCDNCKEETFHRVRRHFGHKGDKWHLKRKTSQCGQCGFRTIENSKKRSKVSKSTIVSYR